MERLRFSGTKTGQELVTVDRAVRSPVRDPTYSGQRPTRAAGQFLRRHWELVLISALALDFVWMRFIDMQTSFFGDEAASAVEYVDGGLSAIYSSKLYSPNNHVLYSILSWLTVAALGRHEPAYRIWSVLPAIASAAAVVWWARKRVGKVTAVAVAGILLSAPLLLQITIQARGYGLAQLGMVLAFIAAAEIEERGPGRRMLMLLATGIFVGSTSHYASASGIGLVVLWLLRRRDLRVPVLKAAALGGLGVLIVMGPLISSIISVTPRYTGRLTPLGVQTLLTGPVELGTPTGQMLFTGRYFLACGAQCYSTSQHAEWGWVMFVPAVLGAVFLWRARRRGLLGCLLVPVIGTFAFIIVSRLRVDDRFVLFLLPVYALLSAVGAAAVLRRARRVIPAPVLVALGAAVLLVAAGRTYRFNQRLADGPPIDFKGLAGAYAGTGMRTVVTSMPRGIANGLQWYIGKQVIYDEPAAVHSFLCRSSGPFAFIQGVLPITTTDLSCLQKKYATSEDFPGAGATLLRLWLVQTPGVPRFTARVAAAK